MSLITIKSKNDSRRRAGIEFNRAGVEIDTDDLTQEQVDAIQADPMLVVNAGDVEFVGGKKEYKKAGAKKAAK